MLGSKPRGSSQSGNDNITVVTPPESIDQKAPVELLFDQNSAPIIGIKSPDTIKAYEYNIKSSTLVIIEARINATIPINNVTIWEVLKKLLSWLSHLNTLANKSETTLPDAAIRQLSAVERIAEK